MNGVFNYFSLMVDPEIAARLQKHLNKLTLFLDTNFLFNILDIDEHNYYLEISKELVFSINKHKLPFRLRYHQATEREMREAIVLHGSELKKQERTSFHRNGATPLDAESFLKRYQHVEVLLREKNITVHRSQLQRRNERAELLEKYQQFLPGRGRTEEMGRIRMKSVERDRPGRKRRVEPKRMLLQEKMPNEKLKTI